MNTTSQTKLPMTLKFLRMRNGYTGVKVAEMLGCSRQWYYNMESGKQKCGELMLNDIAKLYGYTLKQFLKLIK